jgi:F0F1-type ATP synthase assembly protein I
MEQAAAAEEGQAALARRLLLVEMVGLMAGVLAVVAKAMPLAEPGRLD